VPTTNTLTNLSSPFFVGKILTVVGSGAYTFSEVWTSAAAPGTLAVKDAGRYGSSVNLGYDVTGAGFSVGDDVLVRQADGTGGNTWELYPIGGSGGGAGITVGDYGDVIGPDWAYTGAVTLFTDPSGRFIGPAPTLSCQAVTVGNGIYQGREHQLWLGGGPQPYRSATYFDQKYKHATHHWRTYEGSVIGGIANFDTSTAKATLHYILLAPTTDAGSTDQVNHAFYIDGDAKATGFVQAFTLNGNSNSGRFEFTPKAAAVTVVCSVVGIEIWQAHYTSTGVAGISGSCTVKVAGVDKTLTFVEGIITGLA
jgi:hypothetical protein